VSRIVVTGSSSGLGRCIVQHLEGSDHNVLQFDIAHGADVRNPSVNKDFLKGGVDVLINCAGIVRLDWVKHLSSEDWNSSMDVNAKGILRMSQHLMPELKRSKGTILNIVSSAADMPMRTSAAYCASKAAALMLTRVMARELAPDITVFSVSPNRLKGTGMSTMVDDLTAELRDWTIDEVREKQLAASLIGEETPPDQVAGLIAYLLIKKSHHKYLTGCDIPYGV
jgi:NAD(P)-dependent dehydrogenase (short-subunit alcohol dehydrogenase family)